MKILSVFGATGVQGGSVVRAVLADPVLSKEYKIRAVTRDINKPAAQALAAQGVEVVVADMSTPTLAAPAVQDAHTVFIVTNFWEHLSGATEIAQGKAVVDAAKAAGVQHIIWSSLLDVSRISNGRLPHVVHFDAKAVVEQYVRDSGVQGTFFLAGMYMSNFDNFFISKDEEGYKLEVPVDPERAVVPLIDAAEDSGKFVVPAIKHFPKLVGTRILGASEYLTLDEVVKQFSQVMGQPARAIRVPDEEWKKKWPPQAAQEMMENLKLLESPGYFNGESLDETLALLDERPSTWREYVARNRDKF